MKLDTTPTNNRPQSKISDISSLEECFVKLKVDNGSTELVENKLKDLNLEDETGKLIERGPIPKDTKLPNPKPYQKVTENVSVRHSCGGTAFCITDISQQNHDNINDSFGSNNFEANNYEPTNSETAFCITDISQQNHDNINDSFGSNNFEANNYEPTNSEYRHLLKCDTCKLELANNPAFVEYSSKWLDEIKQYDELQLQHSLEEEKQLNLTNINHTWTSDHIDESANFKAYPELIKSSVRRISYDSGFQSDNPSPCSDCVLSPTPFRKILPKATEMQKKEENINNGIQKMSNNETRRKYTLSGTEKSAKELLRSTLNAEIKQVKWIELVVEKSNDELFETSNCEQTILHKVLQSDEKYIAESLYAIVEKMKMNPDRCSCILASQSSICETIKQNKHPQLWLDYFCEAMQIIQHKMEAQPSRN